MEKQQQNDKDSLNRIYTCTHKSKILLTVSQIAPAILFKNYYVTLQAMRMQAPPTAVILLSAVLEKYLALTTTG